MAETALTLKDMRTGWVDIDPAGSDFEAANVDGNSVAYPDDGNLYLAFDSGGTGATVTINSQQACDQGEDHDITLVLSTNETVGPRKIPPRCKDANGDVHITYTSVTDIKALALKG